MMEESDNDHNILKLQVAYFTHLGINSLIIICTAVYLCYKLHRERRDFARDLFKIIQYIICLLYLIFLVPVGYLPLISRKTYFVIYLYFDRIVLILFYTFETVNIAGWVNTILHLKNFIDAPVDSSLMIEKIEKNKKKELYLIGGTCAIILINFLLLLVSKLLFVCQGCYAIEKDKIYDLSSFRCEDKGSCAYSLGGIGIGMLIALGVLQIIAKLIVCSSLCKSMKKILLGFYNKKKRLIIATSIFTGLALILKITSTIISYSQQLDINYLMASRTYEKEEKSAGNAWYAFALYHANLYSEIFVMIVSIENISFKGYVLKLLQGKMLDDEYFISSHFILKPSSKIHPIPLNLSNNSLQNEVTRNDYPDTSHKATLNPSEKKALLRYEAT